MRILHTSDWHLGQTLHDVPREHEHGRFLAWLKDTLAAERIDALVVAGDVFDRANPPPWAQRAYYELLASCRERLPDLDIVVVGGNHDSPGRLDAPQSLLSTLGVRVVGGLPRRPDGAIDLERTILPLRRPGGEVGAWIAAVPFLRPADLPAGAERGQGQLVAGVSALYDEILGAARRARRPGQALLATGHCYMVGGELSPGSERKIQLGMQEALPASIFAGDIAYVALGHLHRAQAVAGRPGMRYCGSPIPLSISERDYRHQVLLVELDGEHLGAVRELRVPRTVDIHIVPPQHRPLPEVLPLLLALPRSRPEGASDAERPYLEVRVQLEAPHPRLRQEVEQALAGAWARLVRIDTVTVGSEEALGDQVSGQSLRELDPEEIFQRCYRRHYDDDAPPELARLFHELLESVQGAP